MEGEEGEEGCLSQTEATSLTLSSTLSLLFKIKAFYPPPSRLITACEPSGSSAERHHSPSVLQFSQDSFLSRPECESVSVAKLDQEEEEEEGFVAVKNLKRL